MESFTESSITFLADPLSDFTKVDELFDEVSRTYMMPGEDDEDILTLYTKAKISTPEFNYEKDSVMCTEKNTTTDIMLLDELISTYEACKKVCRYSNFEHNVQTFTKVGSKFISFPLYNDFIRHDSKQKHWFVNLKTEDFCMPFCHEGMNRSQVLYMILQTLKHKMGLNTRKKLRLSVPHGAESGFDPHKAYKDLTEETLYGYIHGVMLPKEESGEWLHQNFHATFGVDKSQRIGSNGPIPEANLNPTDEESITRDFSRLSKDRTKQREIMDNLLYDVDKLNSYVKSDNSDKSAGRILVFCFMRSAGIFLSRLLEKSGDKDLSNIHIIALPWPDDISRAGGVSDRDRAEKAGESFDRNVLSMAKHKEIFGTYSTIFRKCS